MASCCSIRPDIVDAHEDLGQGIGTLELAGDVEDVILRVGRDAGGDEGRQEAPQGEEANALARRDLKPRVPDGEFRPGFGPAAQSFDTGNRDLKVLQLHVFSPSIVLATPTHLKDCLVFIVEVALYSCGMATAKSRAIFHWPSAVFLQIRRSLDAP